MDDPQRCVPQATVEMTEWRDSMQVWAEDQRIGAVEIHSRPARPHLANTGMQGYFAANEDPLEGRGTAVVVGVREATTSDLSASEEDGVDAGRLSRPHVTPDRHFLRRRAPWGADAACAGGSGGRACRTARTNSSRGGMRGGTGGGTSRPCSSRAKIRWRNGCAGRITSTCIRSDVRIAGRCHANGMAGRA